MHPFGRALVPLTRRLSHGQPSRTLFSRRGLPALWSPVPDIEESLRSMERHFQRMERDLTSNFGLPAFLKPVQYSASPMTMYESEVPGKYQMNVVLGEGFAPENIKLTLKDRTLTIEAKYDKRSEDGSSRVYQELTRVFNLPKGVDPAQVKSIFTPEGILQIEAPLPELVPEGEKPKEVPISINVEQ